MCCAGCEHHLPKDSKGEGRGHLPILPSGRVRQRQAAALGKRRWRRSQLLWLACLHFSPVQGLRNRCSAGRAENKKTLLFGSLSGNSKQRFGFFPRCLAPRLHLWLPGSPGAHPEGPSVGTGNSSRGPRPRPRPRPHLCAPRPWAQAPPPSPGPAPSSGAAPGLRPRSHLCSPPPSPGPIPGPRPRPHLCSPRSPAQAPPPGPDPALTSAPQAPGSRHRPPPGPGPALTSGPGIRQRAPRARAPSVPFPGCLLPPSPLLSARLTLVRICPEVDTLRISFWGPSCSASLSDESSPGPAGTVAGVTAAPAAPPAAPGGWCWPPAPAILSDSCGNTAPPGGGGGQGPRSARAGPGAPRRRRHLHPPAARAGEGSPGSPLDPGARLRQEQRPRRGAGGAEPGPPGTPERPARNTTRAGSGDGSDGRVRTTSHVPRPRGYWGPQGGPRRASEVRNLRTHIPGGPAGGDASSLPRFPGNRGRNGPGSRKGTWLPAGSPGCSPHPPELRISAETLGPRRTVPESTSPLRPRDGRARPLGGSPDPPATL